MRLKGSGAGENDPALRLEGISLRNCNQRITLRPDSEIDEVNELLNPENPENSESLESLGAPFQIANARLALVNVTVEDCEGTWEGAVSATSSALELADVVFRRNRGVRGGALALINTVASLNSVVFYDNIAQSAGAALYAELSRGLEGVADAGSVTVANTVAFWNNSVVDPVPEPEEGATLP
eukprot:177082-Prorocentrum_minimum.AAC.1